MLEFLLIKVRARRGWIRHGANAFASEKIL